MNEYFLAEIENPSPNKNWIVLFALLAAVLFVVGRTVFPKYNRRVLVAFRNQYEATKLMSEKRIAIPRESIPVVLIPLLTVSMMVFQQLAWFSADIAIQGLVGKFLEILLITTAFVAFRLSAVFFFSWLLKQQEIGLRFNQIWIINFQNLGMFSLIPAFIIPFLIPELRIILLIIMWLGLAVWIGYTIIRELVILNSNGISLFYRILYLCTLEILPLWWATQSITEGW